jgi:hypothetical protein
MQMMLKINMATEATNELGRHLRRFIPDYIRYHEEDRIHDSLDKNTPNRPLVAPRPAAGAHVISMPRLGGLEHRYASRRVA